MKLFESITTLSDSWTAPCRVSMALMGLALLGGAVDAAQSTPPTARVANSNALPTQVTIPQSVFDADSPTGRNPFFPHSSSPGPGPSDATLVPRFPAEVRLSGVSGTPENRLVIINRRTFAEGETGDIKINGKPVSVRVGAIMEASAVITINGVTREIHLRDGN